MRCDERDIGYFVLCGDNHAEFHPIGRVAHVIRIDRLEDSERVVVVRIGHNTDIHSAVTGRGLFQLEGKKIVFGISLRQIQSLSGSHAVGVGGTSGGVEVQGTGAIGMIGRVDVWIFCRTVGVTGPAVREISCTRAAATEFIEAFRVRNVACGDTFGVNADGTGPLGGGGTTSGSHKHLIVRVVLQVSEGGVCAADGGDGGSLHIGTGRGNDGHFVSRSIYVVRPVQLETFVGHIGNCEVVWFCTLGDFLQYDVINKDIVGCIVGGADSNVRALSGVLVEIDIEILPNVVRGIIIFEEALDKGERTEIVRVSHYAHIDMAVCVGRL